MSEYHFPCSSRQLAVYLLFIFSLPGTSLVFYFVALFCSASSPGAPLLKQEGRVELHVLRCNWDGGEMGSSLTFGHVAQLFLLWFLYLFAVIPDALLWRISAFVMNKSKLKKKEKKETGGVGGCSDIWKCAQSNVVMEAHNSSLEAYRGSPSWLSVTFSGCFPMWARSTLGS